MSEKYYITGVQLGILIAHQDEETRRILVEEIIDKQFIGNVNSPQTSVKLDSKSEGVSPSDDIDDGVASVDTQHNSIKQEVDKDFPLKESIKKKFAKKQRKYASKQGVEK